MTSAFRWKCEKCKRDNMHMEAGADYSKPGELDCQCGHRQRFGKPKEEGVEYLEKQLELTLRT